MNIFRHEDKIREALNAAYYLLMDDHRTASIAYDLADVIKRYDDNIKYHRADYTQEV